VSTALAVANDLERLCDLRSRLRNVMATSGFGDPAQYSRAVENAYRDMWRNWCGTQTV
jgi:protein O-GlcNAc transferase